MGQLSQLAAVAALAGGLVVVGAQQQPRPVHPPAKHAAVSQKHHPQPQPKASVTAPRVPQAAPAPRPRPIAVPEKKKATPKKPAAKTAMPSCAIVRREYARMTHAQRLAAYAAATSEQVAHGRRCLGM